MLATRRKCTDWRGILIEEVSLIREVFSRMDFRDELIHIPIAMGH